MIKLDGKALAAKLRDEYAVHVKEYADRGERRPCLAVVLVGDDPASRIYVRNKRNDCEIVGIKSLEYTLASDVSEKELIKLIDSLNSDESVDGILVQLPLPSHLDPSVITERIRADKDVDAFSAVNVGRIALGRKGFKPCTPAGVMRLLKEYNIEISGKECVVVGRSDIVGKPMGVLLTAENGTVTLCHSKTADLASHTRRADILVTAVGKAGIIKGDMIKEGAVVIDVGINRGENGLCGDADFDSCAAKASYITPVPGGVGPMTRAMLLENTLKAYVGHIKH